MATAQIATDPESVARRYYAVVSDLSSNENDLRALLSPAVKVVEHPNALTRRGATRDLKATIAGFQAGKALLSQQTFEVHEVLTAGSRVTVRATWRGVVASAAGPFQAGQHLTAHVAALLKVQNGLVTEHETFDCYEPFD